jgi:hypothetical protein
VQRREARSSGEIINEIVKITIKYSLNRSLLHDDSPTGEESKLCVLDELTISVKASLPFDIACNGLTE